jgi:hypothetical protein
MALLVFSKMADSTFLLPSTFQLCQKKRTLLETTTVTATMTTFLLALPMKPQMFKNCWVLHLQSFGHASSTVSKLLARNRFAKVFAERSLFG